MQPRYRTGLGDAAVDAVRSRVLEAARAHLLELDAAADFSMDVIAAKAGVARSELQRQFRSRGGLLEALYDELLLRSQLRDLPAAFDEPEPEALLGAFLRSLTDLFRSQRVAMRRLRALAAFDAELAHAVRARDDYRRETLSALLRRLVETGYIAPGTERDALPALHALTSFEVIDRLAGPGREPADALPLVLQLARCALRASLRRPTRAAAHR